MNIMTNRSKISGFSLIELALAVSIIALLISVISYSRYIKDHAKIRQVVSDLYNYEALFNNFKDAYNQYPGDFDIAYNYFGDDCDTTASECNGDGDGYIESGSSGDQERENLRLWQHLNLSGMLAGNYTVNWAAIGADGHTVSNSFSFTVDPAAGSAD